MFPPGDIDVFLHSRRNIENGVIFLRLAHDRELIEIIPTNIIPCTYDTEKYACLSRYFFRILSRAEISAVFSPITKIISNPYKFKKFVGKSWRTERELGGNFLSPRCNSIYINSKISATTNVLLYYIIGKHYLRQRENAKFTWVIYVARTYLNINRSFGSICFCYF